MDEGAARPSGSIIGIGGRSNTTWASTKSLKVFTIAAFFAVASSVYLLTGKQTILGQSSRSCDFPAVFNFGDSNSDTGGMSAAFHRVPWPNGKTFFQKPSGRYSDGKVIIDFIAEKLRLPFLSAYLDSFGANFRHGANFATGGSTIQPRNVSMFKIGYSPFSLDIQLAQFEQFKERVDEIYKEGVNSDIKSKLPRPEDFSQALYTFDIGQNDLHAAINLMTEKQVMESVSGIVDLLAQAIENLSLPYKIGLDHGSACTIKNKQLHEQGARTFWIHNTGPVGCLPSQVLDHPPQTGNVDQNGCIRSHNEIAQEFNRQLKEKVIELRMQFPDAVLTYVDVYSAKYSLISDAKKHGFVNPLRDCCGHYPDVPCWSKNIVNETSCSNPSAYISWDGIHYSHAANQWVANKVIDGSLSDSPTPITEACRMPLHL